MTWPIPWVILTGPQLDNEDAGPGGRSGVVPAHGIDNWSELGFIEGSPSQNINNFTILNQCLRPICMAVPWPYDNAGVSYPSGTLLVLTGLRADATIGGQFGFLRGSGGTGSITISTIKHVWPLRIRVFGMAPGASGTVKIGHKTDYSSGAPTIFDHTFSFSGADGADQVAVLEAPVSGPAARSASVVFTIVDSWSGGTPTTVVADYNATHITRGRLVPDTLPDDFTPRPDADDHRGACWGNVDRGYTAAASRRWRAPALHPSNWRFHVESEPVAGAPSTRSKGIAFSVDNYRFGAPDTFSQQLDVSPTWNGWPTAWLDDDLKPIEYQSCAFGVVCPLASGGGASLVCNFNTTGPHTFAAVAPFPTAYGPGWRNCRFYLDQDFVTTVIGVPCTINSITAKVYLDGVLFGSASYSGPFTKDAHWELADVLPVARTASAKIETKFEANVTLGAIPFPGDIGGITNGSASVRYSPRCDIPIPTTVVGPDNEVAPGGYLATKLGTSPKSGQATIHNAAGVTSCVFALINANTNVKGAFAATFLPAATGIYRVSLTGRTITMGECEFRIGARTSAIGRANKRFWGFDPAFGTATAITWTLVTVAKVTTAIPSGAGLTMNSGHLTDGNWFFGTIAAPAAGYYRLTVPCAAGSGLLVAMSLTDPFVADHLAGPCKIVDGASSGSPTSIEICINVAAARTIYVRIGAWDPYYRLSTDSPLDAGVNGKVRWAAVP